MYQLLNVTYYASGLNPNSHFQLPMKEVNESCAGNRSGDKGAAQGRI